MARFTQLIELVVSAVVEVGLLWNVANPYTHGGPPSWHIWNLSLAGGACLLAVSVLRRSRGWRRVAAALLTLFPASMVGLYAAVVVRSWLRLDV